MLTDTHCHLSKEYYEDLDLYVKEAFDNDVKRIIVASTNLNDAREVIEIAHRFENVYYCLGIHPEFYKEDVEDLKAIIEEVKDDKKFVGIGEIGLDYYYDKSNKDRQIELFKKQLDLALEYDKAVVIHSREATKDLIDTLRDYHLRGIVHCFTGSIETAKILIGMGYHIGVGGVMTFKNAKVDEVIKQIDIKNITLETDAPYLSPEPFRGKKNCSKNVLVIAKYLAKIKDISLAEVEEKTEKNVQDIFDI